MTNQFQIPWGADRIQRQVPLRISSSISVKVRAEQPPAPGNSCPEFLILVFADNYYKLKGFLFHLRAQDNGTWKFSGEYGTCSGWREILHSFNSNEFGRAFHTIIAVKMPLMFVTGSCLPTEAKSQENGDLQVLLEFPHSLGWLVLQMWRAGATGKCFRYDFKGMRRGQIFLK